MSFLLSLLFWDVSLPTRFSSSGFMPGQDQVCLERNVITYLSALRPSYQGMFVRAFVLP
jgi:hypothetical protein